MRYKKEIGKETQVLFKRKVGKGTSVKLIVQIKREIRKEP
jgi:hypothetical protein